MSYVLLVTQLTELFFSAILQNFWSCVNSSISITTLNVDIEVTLLCSGHLGWSGKHKI